MKRDAVAEDRDIICMAHCWLEDWEVILQQNPSIGETLD